MCLERRNPLLHPFIAPVPGWENDAIETDDPDLVPTQHTPPVLDTTFVLNVCKPILAASFSRIQLEIHEAEFKQLCLGLRIVPLEPTTREHIEFSSDLFWDVFVSPGQAVSVYYQRGCMQNILGMFAIEPGTAVVGQCVVLCIELYFNRLDLIAYRDILTTAETTLQSALCSFNRVMGFPEHTQYTFIHYDEGGGWTSVDVSPTMLALPIRSVLCQASVRESYSFDFFRLSPKHVQQCTARGGLTPSQLAV